MLIEAYVDGSYIETKNQGGYGVVLKQVGEEDRIISRGYNNTTGNRMELMAVIVAVNAIKKMHCEGKIYSDSKYVVNAIQNGWLSVWANNNWKRSNGKELKNKDLWQRLWSFFSSDIKIIWIKSHNNITDHDKAHVLAYNAANGKKFWRDMK